MAKDSKPWSTPYAKVTADGGKKESDVEKLSAIREAKAGGASKSSDAASMGELCPEDATTYRGHVARANFLSADRPDIGYAVKELSRGMSKPNASDWNNLVHLARYLKGSPRAVTYYNFQTECYGVQIYTDSDWAGCKRTRRSTSGGCVMRGSHFLKAWCKTQGLIALSSGEAELYALVKATAEGMGIAAIFKDIGRDTKVSILGDASAALGIVRRQGLGIVRHLDVSWLWVQEKNRSKQVDFGKVDGKSNVADLMTKGLSDEVIRTHMNFTNMAIQDTFDPNAISTRRSTPSSSTLGHLDAVIKEIRYKFDMPGDLKAWIRNDIKTNTFKTTMRGGPNWNNTKYRITLNSSNGNIIDVEDKNLITKEIEHRRIANEPIDDTTVILYKVDAPTLCTDSPASLRRVRKLFPWRLGNGICRQI